MLKKFILNALSSFVGAWLAIVLLLVGVIIFIFGLIGSFTTGEIARVGRHSVMKIVLSGNIEEIENAPQIDISVLMSGRLETAQTLKGLLSALENAKSSSDIEALFIECEGVQASPATLDALRNGIKDFKESGKRVFAYGDYLTMGDYYVATIADAVYLNPAGSLDLQGINGTTLYFKELLDKIGVDVQAVRVGTFKSAIEPYTSNEMSEPAKMQLDSLYGEMWNYILEGVTTQRKVKAATVDTLVNHFIFLDEASKAKEYNLVDDCLYYRQVIDVIAEYVGEDPDNINFVSPELLMDNMPVNPGSKNQIAVLYAVGEIGEYEGAGINCHQLVPLIVKFAEDENIKGLVLRVNSPGGSVFGSEQIGEALDYFKSKGKPLAVSMGDYAASGGYWISAGADIIYADPLTVTGSIGIFGLVPNVSKLASNIGVHPQIVGTNPSVLFPSIFFPMSPEQEAALQTNVERGYDKFINRVAQGRHKSPEYIKSIAEGRVWNAIKAKQLGLVDQLGGLGDAVDWVTQKAGVEKPNIVSYPLPEANIWSMLSSSSLAQTPEVKAVADKLRSQQLDEKMVMMVEWFLLQNHVQARIPYYKITL